MKFIYQYKASMSLNCAVRLPHHESSTFNNGTVNSTFSKNTDVSFEPTGVKRHTRMSRKRTFQDNFNTEDNNQSDNIKKKKCIIKKQQSTKTKTEKPITGEKNDSKIKSEVSTIEKITNNPTNTDVNVIPDTGSPGGISEKANNSTISIENSLNTPKKIMSNKSNNSFAKKTMNHSNQNVTSNKLDKSNNSILPKSTKYKSSKSISPIKVKFTTNNIKKSDKSNGLEISKNFGTSKTSKRKGYSKSVSPVKNKCVVNSINKDDPCNKLEKSNNLITSTSPKNKTTKSITITKKKSMSNNVNKNDTPSNDSEKKIDLITSKNQKIRTLKSITTLKKMLVTNYVNKNNTSGVVEETDDVVITRKRGRSSLKKVQQQNFAINNYNDMMVDSEQTKKVTVLLEKNSSDLTKNSVDNTITIRSNKPPKIKKKWSDKWCGNKSSKSNTDDHSSIPKIETNNPENGNKKPLKIQKQKNSNYKKLKTKILEKLNTNNDSVSINVLHTCDSATNSLLSTDISNTSDIADKAKTNIPGIQNQSELILNSVPSIESTVTVDETTTESVKVDNNESCNIETIYSSEVNTLPTTSTKMPNALITDNRSHITFEPVNDSSYLSVPESEISYGISILSEAISRQCNETMNNSTKTDSSKQDIYEMMFSPKKSNSSPQPLLPNAILQSHKNNKTMPKEKDKYSSEFCNQSSETKLPPHMDHELCLLSKRFNIPIDVLKKTVLDEPLSIFQKNYSASVTPSMIRVTPIVNDIEAKSKDHVTGNLDVEYKLDPIRESVAYEQTNLKDLMTELSKTMPSWSLSIVTNPPRYVISHMSINKYGVPIANKSIVLDSNFRASVYINQCLEHKYCKLCSTATEIINLIKDLNSI